MKNITIAGRLTRNAVIRDLDSGDKVANFSVAVDDRSTKDKSTLFFDCALFGKRGVSLGQYLTKGTQVCVSGELGKREHDGRTYLTVRANEITLLGGGERKERDPHGQDSFADNRSNFTQDLDDEIPF